jgi:hypothetical protein
MLTEFWGLLRGFSPRTDIVVRHSIFDFDLKFIYKRSVMFGVRPSVDLSFARYRNQPAHIRHDARMGTAELRKQDKARQTAEGAGWVSSKDSGIDGSLVHTPYKAGEHVRSQR